MKKGIVIILLILIVVIAVIIGINVKTKAVKLAKWENEQYEKYLNSEIYGTDVITLINKATNSNESNSVLKDTKGNYINNNIDSIQIDIEFITNESKHETILYNMEKITKLGTSEFIKNFNDAKFECTSKEYHKDTGKIKYIKFTHVSG